MKKSKIPIKNIELNISQMAAIALFMYQEWQKAMKPPLFAVTPFGEWLNRLIKEKIGEDIKSEMV